MSKLRGAAWIAGWLMAISQVLALVITLPREGGAAFQAPLGRLFLTLTVALVALGATFPIFLLALARDRSRLVISRESRLLTWGVAGILFFDSSWNLYKSLNLSYLALILVAPDLAGIQTVLGNLSNFSLVLLLVAIARHEPDGSAAELVAPSLWKMTRVVVVCWGLVLCGLLLRLGILPYLYYQSREQIAQLPVPPSIYMLWGQPVEQLVQQACLFAIPLIIAKSIQKRAPEETPVVVTAGMEN